MARFEVTVIATGKYNKEDAFLRATFLLTADDLGDAEKLDCDLHSWLSLFSHFRAPGFPDRAPDFVDACSVRVENVSEA